MIKKKPKSEPLTRMTKEDAKVLDAALALYWQATSGDTPPYALRRYVNYGTRARDLERRLEIAISGMLALSRALRRPFARGSAAVLVRGEPRLSMNYNTCIGDLVDDLIDAGLAVQAKKKRERKERP